MNTIHIYEFPADKLILAARAARSFSKKDSDDILYDFGGLLIHCWRTKAGNTSIRWVK